MRDFRGKGAFVTGGASGIGFALASAFLQAGMKVMIADIDQRDLDHAVAELRLRGEAHGVECDVADRAAIERAAQAAFDALGRVHVLCNNAGVGGASGPQEQIKPGDWEWTIGVNLMGVIHGVGAVLPHIKAHGEGGHVVNVASLAGMASVPTMGPYCATKFAVVALSEGLAAELQGTPIGVSVLCPGWVRTRIVESGRNRPERYGGRTESRPGPLTAIVEAAVRSGMEPAKVAAQVMAAIRDNELYVFTHPEMREATEERFRRILAAFDRAAVKERA
jgi:NAD(P)-dependent dehydrogenase (short-subunit alcohol dehydrogenase family)